MQTHSTHCLYHKRPNDPCCECRPNKKDCLWEEPLTYTSTWTAVNDPMWYTICPHCKAEIFMTKTPFMTRLLNWAKRLKNF